MTEKERKIKMAKAALMQNDIKLAEKILAELENKILRPTRQTKTYFR